MTDINDYTTSFKIYVEKNLSLSPLVVKKHMRNIILFNNFIERNALNEKIAESKTIIDFIKDYKASNITANTIMSSLNHLFNHLILRKLVKNNPIPKIRRPKRLCKYHQYVSYATIQKIINTPDDSHIFGLRDKTIFTLLYNTGMRANELCKLSIADIDITNALIRIKSKGHERIIPLHKHAILSLTKYLNKRHILTIRNTPYLFVNNYGRKIQYHTLRKMLKKYLKQAKIKQPFSTHTFRHAYASHLIMAGANIRVVQFLLGHQSIDTTQIYVQLRQSHLKKLHSKYHPRSTFAKIEESLSQINTIKLEYSSSVDDQ